MTSSSSNAFPVLDGWLGLLYATTMPTMANAGSGLKALKFTAWNHLQVAETSKFWSPGSKIQSVHVGDCDWVGRCVHGPVPHSRQAPSYRGA